MSVNGTKRTSPLSRTMSAFGGKADIAVSELHVSAYDPERTSSRRSYVPWLKSVELFGTRGLVKGRDTIDGDGRHMPPIVRGPEQHSVARTGCGHDFRQLKFRHGVLSKHFRPVGFGKG